MILPTAVTPLRCTVPRPALPRLLAMTARRPRPEESFEDFVEGVGRVSTQVLRRALVSVYQASERKCVCACAFVLELLSFFVLVLVLVP